MQLSTNEWSEMSEWVNEWAIVWVVGNEYYAIHTIQIENIKSLYWQGKITIIIIMTSIIIIINVYHIMAGKLYIQRQMIITLWHLESLGGCNKS